MPAQSRTPSPLILRALHCLLIALSIFFVLLFLDAAIHRMRFPFEVEWIESGILVSILRITQGHGLYVKPTLSFVPYLYAPLYLYLTAGVVKLLGGARHGYLAMRLVSTLATFGSCGVIYAMVLRQARNTAHRRIAALAAATLFIASYAALDSFYDVGRVDSLFVFLIALLAAFQIASFRKADRYSYNSTFITGDLRTTIVGLYESLNPAKRTEGLGQFRDIGLVVICFVLGALAAAWLSPRLGNHTLWVAFLALAVVFALALRRSLFGEAARCFPYD